MDISVARAPSARKSDPSPTPGVPMTPFADRPLPGLTQVLHIHTLLDRCRVRTRSSHAATPVLFSGSVHFRDRSLQHHFASSTTKPQKTQRNRDWNNLFSLVVPSPRPKRLRKRGWTPQQRGRSVLNPGECVRESVESHPNRRGSEPAPLRQIPLPHPMPPTGLTDPLAPAIV